MVNHLSCINPELIVYWDKGSNDYSMHNVKELTVGVLNKTTKAHHPIVQIFSALGF